MHFVRMQAEAMPMRDAPVFSHWSAAVAWGIPIVGPLPEQAHMIAAGSIGRRTQRGIVWHNDHVDESEIARIGGVRVTSLPRTLLDLARVLPFASAVAAVDFGIRPRLATPWGETVEGVDHPGLQARADESAGLRGIRAARRAIRFADARSGSPGESVSRANMHLLGIPAPELQVGFARSDGGHDIVDFDWPELGRFGEFDGRAKYFRDEFANGRSPEQVLWDEKLREDRIRRHRPVGVRWDWSVATRPTALAARLAEFGVHPSPSRRALGSRYAE